MCDKCETSKNWFIGEAYGDSKTINEHIKLYIDGQGTDPILSLDHDDDGYYVDIKFCPFCGQDLMLNKTIKKV